MTTSTQEAIAAIGELLTYPEEGLDGMLQSIRARLGSTNNKTSEALTQFADEVNAHPVGRQQELYSSTFELSPVCTPYLSVHLFGEQSFRRSELMVALAARQQQCGFEPGNELPDHIAVVLRFARHLDESEWIECVTHLLAMPLKKMHAELCRTSNPYRLVLQAIIESIALEFTNEELSCWTPSSSRDCPTPHSSCSSPVQSIGIEEIDSAIPPCLPSFSKAGACCGAPFPGMPEY